MILWKLWLLHPKVLVYFASESQTVSTFLEWHFNFILSSVNFVYHGSESYTERDSHCNQQTLGHSRSSSGNLFAERMIPVRIACNREQITQILKTTMEFYDQEAVMAYKVSEDVIILNR
jgi:hypothetical protein